MQLLGLCNAALSSPLAAARTNSTQALTPQQLKAGASVASLERRLTEDGKLALIALITGSRATHAEAPPPAPAPAAQGHADQLHPAPPRTFATPLGVFLGEHFLAGTLEAERASRHPGVRHRRASVSGGGGRRASALALGGDGGLVSAEGTIGGGDTYQRLRAAARPGLAGLGLSGQRGRPAAAATARVGGRGV
jgi:hypothetical protein